MSNRHSSSLDQFRATGAGAVAPGPCALLVIEDTAEIATTLDHLAAKGFKRIVAFAPEDIALPDRAATPIVHRVTMNTRHSGAMADAVNTALAIAPAGTWFHACYNAEYLIYPFCEDRSIGEMLAFQSEEKRDAMITFVVDLYAGDLAEHPDGVDRDAPYFDRIGYYALARPDPANHNYPRERQLDFFGGLRWRFEEHVDAARRRIDRIGLFRASPNLHLRPDNTFTDPEYNTYACRWHNNLTAAICSFRAAKALTTNPLSSDAIDSFLWQGSERFDWRGQSLMDHGLMEPGQWF